MKLEGRGGGLANVGGGTVEASEDELIITKRNINSGDGGIASFALNIATSAKGGYSIPYQSIISVHLSEGGFMSQPFIQFLTSGETSVGNANEATDKPNCVLFKKSALDDFAKLKKFVEEKIKAAKSNPVQQVTSGSVADELAKLANLKETGILSEDEFQAQKAKLLG